MGEQQAVHDCTVAIRNASLYCEYHDGTDQNYESEPGSRGVVLRDFGVLRGPGAFAATTGLALPLVDSRDRNLDS
jgi:hypothetical protein